MRKRIVSAVIGAAGLAAGLVSPAQAAPPVREPISFLGSFDFPAGEICDFAYHREVTITGTLYLFFDKQGEIVREMDISRVQVLHRNADTGFTLTESIHTHFVLDATKETVMQSGQNWQLRDAQGRIVVVHSGNLLFDLEQEELVRVTPNFGAEFADVLCPALGGSPA
jgi:hypothetical protein